MRYVIKPDNQHSEFLRKCKKAQHMESFTYEELKKSFKIASVFLLRQAEMEWKDYVRGEWWIDDSGQSRYCDINVGDTGHEGMAIEDIIGRHMDDLIEGIEEYNKDTEDKVDLSDFNSDDEWAATRLFNEIGIPREVGEKVFGADIWKLINKDVRLAYAKMYNAILVINLDFAAYKIDADTIKRIQDFLYEEVSGIGEKKLDGKMTIEEYSTSKNAELPVDDFLNIKHPGELWRVKSE